MQFNRYNGTVISISSFIPSYDKSFRLHNAYDQILTHHFDVRKLIIIVKIK